MFSQLGLLYLRHWSEGFANTSTKLNYCNYKYSFTTCDPWISGIYLAK